MTVGSGTTDFNGLGAGTVLSHNWISTDGNPGFVSPATYNPSTYVGLTGDFHLRETSPCRDAGVLVGVNYDYDDNPRDASPDIGAFEYQVPPGPTPTPVPGAGVDDRWDLYE